MGLKTQDSNQKEDKGNEIDNKGNKQNVNENENDNKSNDNDNDKKSYKKNNDCNENGNKNKNDNDNDYGKEKKNNNDIKIKKEDNNKNNDESKNTLNTDKIWTVKRETDLFKCICRLKPVGVHKHFRMIDIANELNNNRYNYEDINKDVGGVIHISEIWNKLNDLYDLESLDEMEFEPPLEDEQEPIEKHLSLKNRQKANINQSSQSVNNIIIDGVSHHLGIHKGKVLKYISSTNYNSNGDINNDDDNNNNNNNINNSNNNNDINDINKLNLNLQVTNSIPVDRFFPNPLETTDFDLPWLDYGQLVLQRAKTLDLIPSSPTLDEDNSLNSTLSSDFSLPSSDEDIPDYEFKGKKRIKTNDKVKDKQVKKEDDGMEYDEDINEEEDNDDEDDDKDEEEDEDENEDEEEERSRLVTPSSSLVSSSPGNSNNSSPMQKQSNYAERLRRSKRARSDSVDANDSERGASKILASTRLQRTGRRSTRNTPEPINATSTPIITRNKISNSFKSKQNQNNTPSNVKKNDEPVKKRGRIANKFKNHENLGDNENNEDEKSSPNIRSTRNLRNSSTFSPITRSTNSPGVKNDTGTTRRSTRQKK